MYLLSALLRPLPFSLSFLSPVLVLLLSLPLVPSVLAIPASEQFALSTQTQASACFIKCHNEFCDIHDMPGNTKNFPSAITINCGLADWQRIMPRCLAVTCVSAPDVAYAVEYGRHFCARAGVPDVKFEMPERFLLSEGGAYYNDTLASTAGRNVPALAAVFAAGTLALLV